VPESVTRFRREGVVYRGAEAFAGLPGSTGRRRRRQHPVALPECETSLVWPADRDDQALARFVRFVRDRKAGPGGTTPV
jgi:hypothetical protein